MRSHSGANESTREILSLLPLPTFLLAYSQHWIISFHSADENGMKKEIRAAKFVIVANKRLRHHPVRRLFISFIFRSLGPFHFPILPIKLSFFTTRICKSADFSSYFPFQQIPKVFPTIRFSFAYTKFWSVASSRPISSSLMFFSLHLEFAKQNLPLPRHFSSSFLP